MNQWRHDNIKDCRSGCVLVAACILFVALSIIGIIYMFT